MNLSRGKNLSKIRSEKTHNMVFPHNKKFIFTILDDTDDATTENIVPIYELLTRNNIFVTKTVWPVSCPEGSRIYHAGKTLADTEYLRAVKRIKENGHEIAFHCATMESSLRSRTQKALEFMQKTFGELPKIHCNHGKNIENIYWGEKRFSISMFRYLYKTLVEKCSFQGEKESSDYYWGDMHKKYIKYTRNFTFKNELNILTIDPDMPYLDRRKDKATYFFSTTDAPDALAFNKLVTKSRIDKLENEAGVCILSTHLGKRYCINGEIDRYFKEIIEYISKKDGWFVPTSVALDYLLSVKNSRVNYPSRYKKFRLEFRYIMDAIGR
jgi:hypothetical protein